jgi:hypothetical protein
MALSPCSLTNLFPPQPSPSLGWRLRLNSPPCRLCPASHPFPSLAHGLSNQPGRSGGKYQVNRIPPIH